MLSTFEVKTYKQLELLLGFMNTVLLVILILVAYFTVITTAHRMEVDQLIAKVSAERIWALAPLSAVAVLWAWVATQLLRLHDRVHEPHIRKWRAIYDADFILRALVLTFGEKVPGGLFERAYTDKHLCTKMMQRLFYNFVGDETKTAEGQRLFVYSEMARYWTLSLVALYCLIALVAFGCYGVLLGARLPAGTILAIGLLLLVSEAYSNYALDSAHAITLEQVSAIHRAQPDEWHAALAELLAEEGIARG